MAFIKINELRPAGSELFQDSESYLNELSEQELSATFGGDGGDADISAISQVSQSMGISIVTFSVVSQVNTNVIINFNFPGGQYRHNYRYKC
jgi:hypothetical protein